MSSYTPIRLLRLDEAETVDDVADLLDDLVSEINDRFEVLYQARTGQGPSTSNQAIQHRNGLADTIALGTGVLFELSANRAVTLTGFSGGYGGRVAVIKNTSVYTYTLAHESTAALPSHRVATRTAADGTIASGAGLVLVYDDVTTRWVPICTQV